MENKKQLKSILVDKIIYDKFKLVAKANGFKIKEITEILMKIYQDSHI